MGKITKTMTTKHRETLSPWLKAYVDEACTTPLPLLPNKLAEFPSRWSFGRGDLYHWIPLLNRFDSILERFCALYELGKGPQTRDFGSELVAKHSGDSDLGGKDDWQQTLPQDFRIHDDADRLLVESVLGFSTMLLKQCGNRSVYASSSHLNDLLNSSSWSVLMATLEVAFELAKRYQASVRRLNNPSRQWNAALLANHYNIDLDRVQQLAAPFVKSTLAGLGESVTTATPSSTSKSKDGASVGGAKGTHKGIHHNDLVSLACTQNDRWTGWGDVQIKYFPEEQLVPPQSTPQVETAQSLTPATPTPLRRTQTMTTHSHSTPRSRPGHGEQSSPLGPSTPFNHEDPAGSSQKLFELPHSVVSSASIPELLSRLPNDMPSATRYEAFHRLRVAKAILSTQETRQRALAVRFLAITNLAYIHNEATFIEKVFRQDGEETRRFQLIYQLAELIRPSADGTSVVPLWLQSISMVLLEVLAYFSTKTQDVLSAVNANVNHGVLLYVIRKAAAGLRDDDGTETTGKATALDQWRKSLFDMAMYLCVQSRSQDMVSSGLVEVLVEILNFRSKTVQRYYPTIIGFLESILWYPVNAFNAFLNMNGLDAVASLIVDTVQQAHELVQSGHGIGDEHKSSLIDYRISYYQQQSLRALLRLIHHVMTNSPTMGGNTDRLLRNLVDKSDLLASLRVVISEKKMFGAIDWTYSVTILSDFINNDPTSFSVLMEAGLIKTFLEAITGDTAAVEATVAAANVEETRAGAEDEGPSGEAAEDDEPTPAGSAILADIDDDGRPHPPPEDMLSMDRGPLAKGILPYSDAINVVPQVLNSISLNNAGMKMVVASHAFDHFFQIFENPDHVKGMIKAMEPDQDPNKEIASNVGQSFDELARHHPALRTSITNALIDLVARIRYLGLEKARTDGWGVKLRVAASDGSQLAVTMDGALRSASTLGDESTTSMSGARDADVEMAEPSEATGKDRTDSPTLHPDETVYNCFTPYVQVLSSFLTSCFSNHNLKSGFVTRGGTELLLDICESPCHSSTFGESQASRELGQVISRLVEVSPIRTLPSILNRTQKAVDELQPLVAQTDIAAPYLAPFLNSDVTVSQQSGDLSELVRGGTRTVHALLNAQTLIKILSECFHSSRSHTLTLYPINVYDLYLRLIRSIGTLLPAILTEEAAQASLVPQKWSGRRTLGAVLPDEALEDAEIAQTTQEPEGQAQTDSNASAVDAARNLENTNVANNSNPRYHNYEVLHRLLHPLPPTVYPLFQSLGKSLLPRREPTPGNDAYPRTRQIELAKALADAMLDHLRASVAKNEHTSGDFHYWIIMFLTIQEMLVDNSGPGRHSEGRSSCQLSMPVFFAFKEQGGFDVLNDMLRVLSTCVQSSSTLSEPQPKPKVAGLALKKILDLYYILGNGKYISEGANTCNLQRHRDKTATVPNIFAQFTVEVRAAMLPAVTRLWTTSVVEKIPDHTAKRLIDVLKLIARGEHEPQSTPTDKAPFILTNCPDTRFNWANVRATLQELQKNEAWSDIAHEATYRAYGNLDLAREYCADHIAGIAGPRNPIPPEDQDTNETQEPVINRPSRTSSNGTDLSDGDRMSLDNMDSDEHWDEVGGGSQQSSRFTVPAIPGPTTSQAPSTQTFSATKEGLDKLRTEFRKDLIERCLDVIRTHPSTAMEVADLINGTIMRQDDKEELEDVCSTLTFALSSLALDEDEKKRNGQCISSYAHLLGLLLQNEAFFQNNFDILRDKVEEYVGLLKVSSPNAGEDLPPWIPHILLVLEMLLREDERPVAAQWNPPRSVHDPVEEPVITLPTPLVEQSNRDRLLESVLDLLPRVGKEDMLATSVLRILVILTRKRALAKRVGDKRNLQRLFLMAKQLAGSGSGRLRQNRTTAHIMIILRHIVEDEEVIRQIMRTEIRAEFSHITRARHSHADVASYLRHMAALAPRAPDIFVEVTNELVQFERWSPAGGDRSSTLSLKEPVLSKPDATLTAEADVKPSTEQSDKEMTDVPKPQTELKRPLVENPDGVVHFLLSELVNYREVEDKEPTAPAVDSTSKSGEDDAEPVQAGEPSANSDTSPAVVKDKKPLKPVFKGEEHPIFVYRCFLLSCLTELLQSYTRTKVEFINFKRSAPPLTSNTPIKPRTSVLNYLIYDLLCQGNLNGTTDTIASKKKAATSAQTQKLLVALVTKTPEKPIDRNIPKYEYDDEPDLQFVRKFVLDTISKAYERAPMSDDPLETRYSRMQSLAELMYNMITERDRDAPHVSRSDPAHGRSQAQLRRLMFEKGFIDKLTSSIAEVNVNFPGVKRAIKYILRVLRILTDTAKDLSHANLLPAHTGLEAVEDDIISTSSLSELDDDREETPDLYRNSSLGMLEPGGDDDDESEDGEEDGDDLYGDEYDDEMDYDEDAMSDDDQDNVSEDSEMGEIEGLPGNPDVVEVIMDGDDEDDDEDDEDDSDEDDEDDDEDDLDSADMEDVENRVEIINEDGEPIDDDGNTDWESDGEDDDGIDEEVLQFESNGQDGPDNHEHLGVPGGLINNMARALLEGEEFDPDMMDPAFDDDDDAEDLDDLDEEEDQDEMEEMEDEEDMMLEEDMPMNDDPMMSEGHFHWDMPDRDGEPGERMVLIGEPSHRHRGLARGDPTRGYPPGFVVGGHDGRHGTAIGGAFRSFFSRRPQHAQPAAGAADDGVNPLLRRQETTGQDSRPQASGHSHRPLEIMPEGVNIGGGRRGPSDPIGILGELLDFLPHGARDGHHFHVQIAGPGGVIPPGRSRDIQENLFRDLMGMGRSHGHEPRRETGTQEPHQAVGFQVQSTMERYAEEALMLFVDKVTSEAAKLANIITARLTPAAVARELKLKEAEMERFQKEEAEREERERKLREEKEQADREAKEKAEAEAREAAERAASEAAAFASTQASTPVVDAESGAMEGVENASNTATRNESDEQSGAGSGDASAGINSTDTAPAPTPDQQRVVTVLNNQEVDVTDLGIDPDYLAALPEEYRQEVIAQTISERRTQAREQAPTGQDPGIFQEFLDALPTSLRRDIEAQEAHDRRRRRNESGRNAGAGPGAGIQVAQGNAASGTQPSADIFGEMDVADILLTFPAELREQVLAEQGHELLAQLPPDMAAQARRLQQEAAPAPRNHTPHRRALVAGGLNPPPPPEAAGSRVVKSQQRRTVVQMLDKYGVATLVRLMFIAQQGSIRNHLFGVFADVCENRQNRLEVISTLLQILQEGSTDMHAVDRSFSQLSLKARRGKDDDMKTPRGLKRTSTSILQGAQTSSETSPLLIVQQCLDLLVELCSKNPHVPWLFLTEHETVGFNLKRALGRKGKGKDKDSRVHKFAINSLLTLLDRTLVMDNAAVMAHLADLLNRVTMPLQALDRRRKEADEKAPMTKEGETKEQEKPSEDTPEEPAAPTESAPHDQSIDATSTDAATKQPDAQDQGDRAKKSRVLQPPLIPDQYLVMVVKIFVARECSSKTFQNTIATIKNLSTLEGAKSVFGNELVAQAQLLSKNIVSDLDNLLPHIEKAKTGTEIQGVALANFSPGNSEQNKLLRVLTALDHLFDVKKHGEGMGTADDQKSALLSSLYHNSTFSAMWEKLGACLTAIHQRENMLHVATILLPLIESLMVVCKNTAASDRNLPEADKDIMMSSPAPESRTANLFFTFTEEHRRILNELVRNNPKLMSGTFSLLVKNPKVLEFDNKRNYFNRSVHSRTGQPQHGRPNYPTLNLQVRRNQVFHDSFRSLYFKSGDEMKFGKLNIRFHGEEGVDAGGVTREWFQVLARQMFDPNYVLFIPVSSDRTTFHPNKLSAVNEEHLMFFKFIGRIIGKALYEGRVLDCFFSRAVYKRILGKSVSVKDMESFDPDYYKSLCWMLENDITDIITETFSVEDDEFGVTNVVDLKPGGRDIAVTDENKHEYVKLVVEHKLLSSVKDQMEHFLKGFHDIIPAELISIFNEQELELLISGLPDIDVDDWKSTTEYHNYTPSSPQIQWFWRAVRSFDKEERAKLLQFVTGTSKVPLNGFKELEGMNGIQRFNIHRAYGSNERLPTSHTCFNQLDLPEFESYDALRSQLMKAITQGSEYFGFA